MQPLQTHEEPHRSATNRSAELLGLLAVVAAGSRALGNALTASARQSARTVKQQPSYERFLLTGERPGLFF